MFLSAHKLYRKFCTSNSLFTVFKNTAKSRKERKPLVCLMWLKMWWFESSLLENSQDVPWPAISHTTSLLPYRLNPLALLSNHFLLQRIPTLQLLLCHHWNPKLLAGLQYYRHFFTALTTISFIYIAYIRKIFCYKYFYGNKFMENKSDILITLFRFHQKVLSEITKPFHLRIWENIVECCKRNVFQLRSRIELTEWIRSTHRFHKTLSQRALYRNCTSDKYCLHLSLKMWSNHALLGLMHLTLPDLSFQFNIWHINKLYSMKSYFSRRVPLLFAYFFLPFPHTIHNMARFLKSKFQ